MNNLSAILAVVGVLVALTNVIVEVVKQATWHKLPTNLLALIVAEVLSVAGGVGMCQLRAVPLTWQVWAGLAVLGFLVAYAAMFGFDKLKEVLSWKQVDGHGNL